MLTPPSRGTPLDLDFIGQLTKEVNDMQTFMRGKTVATSQVGSETPALFGSVVFYANSMAIQVSRADPGTTKQYTFTYNEKGVEFKNTPLVVAGIENTGGTTEGNSVTAVVTSNTRGSCTVTAVFNKASTGSITVNVTVIAIGISNK